MNRRQFERQVERAIASIPDEFLRRVDNLTFRVEDWPDRAILDEVGFDDPRELLGYYSGWPLADRTHDYAGCLPDVIILYQGAIENHVRETGQPLLRVIAETLIHELAHYFGFSEEEMDAVERHWSERFERHSS